MNNEPTYPTKSSLPGRDKPESATRRRFVHIAGLLAAGVSPAAFIRPVLAVEMAALPNHVRRGEPNYEAWRQSMMWQFRKAARFPDMIVQASSVADVVATVKYARDAGLKLTTRAGGHSMSACFLRNDGILIDVSRLDGISVDVAKQEAHVGPGVIGRALNEHLRPYKLAFPTAHCGMVPVSGFVLGGGVGWNGNAWGGMSVFNINAVDIVTADGELRRASATENPDLYWAVRGGGPGLFGVVTKFHLRCFPLPEKILGVEYVFRFTDLVEVVQAVTAIGPQVDLDVELLTVVTEASPEHAKACRAAGCDQAVYVNAFAFADSDESADRKLKPFLTHPILKKAIANHPATSQTFETLYYGNELPFPQKRWQADNVFTNRADDVARLVTKMIPECPTKRNAMVLVYKGNPKLPDAAFTTMGQFYLSYYMVWDDAADDVASKAYHRKFFKQARTLSTGSYINEFNQEHRPEDIPDCFSKDAWAKLKRLRSQWDPKGTFHDFFGQAS